MRHLRIYAAMVLMGSLAAAAGAQKSFMTGKPSGPGWTALLNDKNLDGFRLEPAHWKLKNGTLIGSATTSGDHYASTRQAYGDFELHADVKTGGMSIRMRDNSGYVVSAPNNNWNHYYVRAEGYHIQVWLNGKQAVDVVDNNGSLNGPIGFKIARTVGRKTESSFRRVYVRPIAFRKPTNRTNPPGRTSMIDESTKQRIDKWIKDNHRNMYGDAPDTMYAGGTPLFDERTGQRKDRYEYILEKHPELGKK